MSLLRNSLKLILSFLSKWAISKHEIELVVVVGFSGTEIVKEGVYRLLSERYNTRRNTKRISWDLGLPLSILGYEDKRRNVFAWILMILKSILYLAFGPKNKHILVLGANSSIKETARFWSRFLQPDYLILLNNNEESDIIGELVKQSYPWKTKILYNNEEISTESLRNVRARKKFSFSTEENSDLTYDLRNREMSYKNQKVVTPEMIPTFIIPLLAAILAVGVNYDIPIEEAAIDLVKLDLNELLVKQIEKKL